MGRRSSRCGVFVFVALFLAACETPTSVALPAAEISRPAATRWPTPTPSGTHVPLPTLTPTATRTPSPTPLPDLTLEQLRNLAYPNEWAIGGVADVVGGIYQEPADAGSGRQLTIAVADAVAFGDLDGDRREDAAVLLIAHPGDGSTRAYLTIVSSRDGEAEPVATLALGDMLVLRSMVVTSGRLTLELLAHAAGDALCCPSLDSRRIYELDGDALTLVTQWDGPRQQLAAPQVPARQPLLFAPGTAATLVRGSLYPLGDQRFLLPGEAGHALELGVTSPHDLVFLSLRGLEDGTVLTSVVSETSRWSGSFPTTQDYQITLVSLSGSATSYALAAAVDPPQITPIPTLELPVTTPTATVTLTPTLSADLFPTPTQMPALTATVVAQIVPPVPTSVWPVVPSGSVVYLTFDGGPEASGWTQRIADVLLDNGVHGMFFLQMPAGDEARALVRAGHAVGFRSDVALTLDTVGRQALIEMLPAVGSTADLARTRCLRPSYGAMDATTRALMSEMGYEVVLWDASPSALTGDDAVVPDLLSQVHPGTVLRFQVQADGVQTAVVLAQALPLLAAQGYGFDIVCFGADTE